MKFLFLTSLLVPVLVLAEPQVPPASKIPQLEQISNELPKEVRSQTKNVRLRGPRVVGNGGDAVVCRDSEDRKTAELLDYYEARTLRGIIIDMGPADLSVQSKADLALDRIARVRPEWAARYAHRIQNFYRDAQFLKGYSLQDIPDSRHLTLPNGCKIEQLVIQRPVRPENEALFLVNEDLWDLLDNTNKAGILLHEAIYEEALKMGAKNSINTRYLNSKISSALPAFKNEEDENCFFFNLGLENPLNYAIWNKCEGKN